MPTGIRMILIGCYFCKGKGYHRKWFKRKSCGKCDGRGTFEHYE